jgi:hypothetical protein
LIDHLPANSYFNEERANDPEIAEALANLPEAEHDERLIHWTPEYALLAQIFDRLGSLINAVVVMAGGTKLEIEPLQRPVTEIQRARERGNRNRYKAFAARMTRRDTPEE